MRVIIYDIIVSVSMIDCGLINYGYSSYKEGSKSVLHIREITERAKMSKEKRRRHDRQRPLSKADALETLRRSSF